MTPFAALVVIAVIVGVAAVAGVLLSRRTARVRTADVGERIDLAELGASQLGQAGTIVQFSTAYCSRCPSTQRLIGETVRDRAGVEFIHVDVTDTPQLASKYRLTQTPTVLIIDETGVPRTRLSGVISRETLTTELSSVLSPVGGASR